MGIPNSDYIEGEFVETPGGVVELRAVRSAFMLTILHPLAAMLLLSALAWALGSPCAVAAAAETAARATQPPAPAKTAEAVKDAPALAPAISSLEEHEKNSIFGKRRPAAAEAEAKPIEPRRIWTTLIIAMLCLGLLLWGGLLLFKRVFPGGRQMFASPAIEVLGRTHLDPQRYVALLRIGERAIAVGVSPDGIRTVSEITDPAEVGRLLEVARPKTDAGGSVFARLFHDRLKDVKHAEREVETVQAAENLGASIESLRARVKDLHSREDA